MPSAAKPAIAVVATYRPWSRTNAITPMPWNFRPNRYRSTASCHSRRGRTSTPLRRVSTIAPTSARQGTAAAIPQMPAPSTTAVTATTL